MKNVFVFIALVIGALNVYAQKSPITEEIIIQGDQLYLSGNETEANKSYRKAVKSKNVDVILWGAYRLMELETIKDSDDTFVTYHIHIVKESETIESICALYNVSNGLISEYNSIDTLSVGDKILIPKIDE